MKTVSVPTRRHHFATAKAMNSGPWSERTYLGAPRSRARRSRHLTTPSPSMERATSMARHSRLYSSITFKSFRILPSEV